MKKGDIDPSPSTVAAGKESGRLINPPVPSTHGMRVVRRDGRFRGRGDRERWVEDFRDTGRVRSAAPQRVRASLFDLPRPSETKNFARQFGYSDPF